MNAAESLIRSTFDRATTAELPCLPGIQLDIDAPDVLDDLSDLSEFVHALENFLQLSQNDLKKAAPRILHEYKAYEATVDPDCLRVRISSAEEALGQLDFRGLSLVRIPYRDKAVYAVLEAECSWDEEHGIQLVYRFGNELTRVSEQDGCIDE